jgi:hypothetical protein
MAAFNSIITSTRSLVHQLELSRLVLTASQFGQQYFQLNAQLHRITDNEVRTCRKLESLVKFARGIIRRLDNTPKPDLNKSVSIAIAYNEAQAAWALYWNNDTYEKITFFDNHSHMWPAYTLTSRITMLCNEADKGYQERI